MQPTRLPRLWDFPGKSTGVGCHCLLQGRPGMPQFVESQRDRHDFSSSLSYVWLFVTPWTAARQASLSITNSQSLLKFMSIKSVMPTNHLILCCPLLLLPSIFPNIRVFLNPPQLFFFLISWRLITLQYCNGFVIHWHESAMDIHVFPIPIPPPTSLSTQSLWVFPVHQVWSIVSCIQPGLVICFTLDNIHVSMLFSWNIPPSPSPTESKSLFYTSVSVFLFCI